MHTLQCVILKRLLASITHNVGAVTSIKQERLASRSCYFIIKHSWQCFIPETDLICSKNRSGTLSYQAGKSWKSGWTSIDSAKWSPKRMKCARTASVSTWFLLDLKMVICTRYSGCTVVDVGIRGRIGLRNLQISISVCSSEKKHCTYIHKWDANTRKHLNSLTACSGKGQLFTSGFCIVVTIIQTCSCTMLIPNSKLSTQGTAYAPALTRTTRESFWHCVMQPAIGMQRLPTIYYLQVVNLDHPNCHMLIRGKKRLASRSGFALFLCSKTSHVTWQKERIASRSSVLFTHVYGPSVFCNAMLQQAHAMCCSAALADSTFISCFCPFLYAY